MLTIIGERIKLAREEKGISQKKLGLVLGLSDKAISAYEAGRTYPPLDTLFKISAELNKPIFFFLTDQTQDAYVDDSISNIELMLKDIQKEIENIKKKL
jgi:transcriptional regulator with XRE-family HTH domain